MAGTLTEDSKVDGVSGESSRAEWRSSEQVENGTPSTSPPYYDTDDDDCGPKPSELFGKFTWKIESFSQINKRELKSNSFDVGGYKWYILIYPQGCDVFNHLSLFLCVANHDKLLPGWSHFAQFTISVVNKEAKKSKYSDTLHRFWKKEHDWGWKKFIELSKLNDGFLVDDVLIIKAQVQVIRERAERPFRCLDVQYRRELVGVYLSNVDQICRRFIDDRRTEITRLIQDKPRWSSFRAFWLSIDPLTRLEMSRERAPTVLKLLVKHFFLEKDVTSTVVMDALYSGLRSLESSSKIKKIKKEREKHVVLNGIGGLGFVSVDEEGWFVLSEDVVGLVEKAARDTWPREGGGREEKGGHSRSKSEGNLGDDASNNPLDRENKRLTDLGRRTVEFFALIEIFNNRIEVAHQEAVALRRQEELIREEEIAGLIENEKREKRAKKKQSKQQKKNGKKSKDKGKNNKESSITTTITESIPPSNSKQDQENQEDQEDKMTNQFIIIDGESSDDASETARQEASHGYWETDASETPKMVGGKNGKESESTESGSDEEEGCDNNGKVAQAESNRTTKQPLKNKKSQEIAENILFNTEPDSQTESSRNNTALNAEPQQEAVIINSVKDWVHSQISDKVEETTKMKKPEMKISINSNSKTNNFPSLSPLTIKKHPSNCATHPPKIPQEISPTISATPKSAPAGGSKPDPVPTPSPSKSESHKPLITTPVKNNIVKPSIPVTKPTAPVSVPVLVPPVVSTVPSVPVPALSRSASSSARINTEPLPSVPTFVPTSYRNAITGTNRTTNGTTGTVPNKPTSTLELAPNSSPSMFPPLERKDKEKEKEIEKEKEKEKEKEIVKEIEKEKEKQKEIFLQRQMTFSGPIRSNIGTESERWKTSRNPGNEIPQTSTSGSLVSEEFPHLDIINDLLDEDKCFGTRGNVRVSTQNRTRNFTRQYSLPDNRYEGNFINPYSTSMGTGTSNPYSTGTSNTYGTGTSNTYSTGTGTSNTYSTGTGTSNTYSTGTGTSNGTNSVSHVRHFNQVDVMGYANGYDDVAQAHWPGSYVHGEMSNSNNGYVYQMNDYDYEYSNMISGVNYPMYRPSNGY